MKHKPVLKVLLSVLLVAVVLVGGTLAYLVATDSPVLNTFKFADVDTGIEEPDGGNASQKTPQVKNNGDSTVFVRAKAIVVTRDGSSVPVTQADVNILYNDKDYIKPTDGNKWHNDLNAYWVYDEETQWWYYNQTLAKGARTEPLFDGVTGLDGLDKGALFDINVYQETVLAGPNVGDNVVEVAKAAFAKAESKP